MTTAATGVAVHDSVLTADREVDATRLLDRYLAESAIQARELNRRFQRHLPYDGLPPPVYLLDGIRAVLHGVDAELFVSENTSHLLQVLAVERNAATAGASSPSRRAILDAEPQLRVALIHIAVVRLMDIQSRVHAQDSSSRVHWLTELLRELVGRRLPLTTSDAVRLLTPFLASSARRFYADEVLAGVLLSIKRSLPPDAVTDELRLLLIQLGACFPRTGTFATQADVRKIRQRIDLLLGGDASTAPVLSGGDGWGEAALTDRAALDSADRDRWNAILKLASTATGARPTASWLKAACTQLAAIGDGTFIAIAIRWLDLFSALPASAFAQPARGMGEMTLGEIAEAEERGKRLQPAERNATILRGMIWCCSLVDDAEVARAVADATEAAYKKIPWVGARSVKVGNAGCYALAAMPGGHGAVYLSRLAGRVKQASARTTVDAALRAAAARLGLSTADLEEMATPDFGLVDGRLCVEYGEYVAEVTTVGAGRVELRWLQADGTPLRSEPAAVRRTYPVERKALKRTVDDLGKALTAARDRIERLYLDERRWPLHVWRERYLEHPLLALLTRRLIWRFGDAEKAVSGAWLHGRLVDVDGEPLVGLTDATPVRLWHPIESGPAAVLAWRGWLERHAVTQPFKQAHREVYLLTDAERRTATYSNRFAAHILRQHQLKALCDARGWRYQLQGAFDNANVPTLTLPHAGLRVEFWADGLADEAQLSPAGICLYVATDQVRFYREQAQEPLPLAEIPPLTFSEVLRDLDLFVGVASVSNDPTWQDSGPAQYRAYWSDYAFGDLSATARTRHDVLEQLLPRLKIAARCTLSDRFLVVRGALRTYKIHLGSGNILMEPNDQYLCIVPGRGEQASGPHDLFLPFEGDRTLALILSKAFLLAEDTKITDPTITRQIGRR